MSDSHETDTDIDDGHTTGTNSPDGNTNATGAANTPIQSTMYRLSTAGENEVAVYIWPVPKEIKAVIFMVHSWSSYHNRYPEFVRHLYHQGFLVCGYDAYGHGQSSGRSADVPDFETHITDLSSVMDFFHSTVQLPRKPPTILFSAGSGMIAATLVAMHQLQKVDLMIMATPYFVVRQSRLQRFISKWFPLRYMGFFNMNTGVTSKRVVQDEEAQKAYDSDPLTRRRIYARSFLYMKNGARRVFELAPTWYIPTLLIYPENDLLLKASSTTKFASKLPPGTVDVHLIKEQTHMFLLDTKREEYFRVITNWIHKKLPLL